MRKIIQFESLNSNVEDRIYHSSTPAPASCAALCDDGTLWVLRGRSWERQADIPQDQAPEATEPAGAWRFGPGIWLALLACSLLTIQIVLAWWASGDEWTLQLAVAMGILSACCFVISGVASGEVTGGQANHNQ